MDGFRTALSGFASALLLIVSFPPTACQQSARASDDGWTYLQVEGCPAGALWVDGQRSHPDMPIPVRSRVRQVACGDPSNTYEVFVEEGTVRYFSDWGP